MEEQTNRIRAARGESTIKAYDLLTDQLGEIDEHLVSDVATDLMHYCLANGIDIASVIERATMNVYEEVLEEVQRRDGKS